MKNIVEVLKEHNIAPSVQRVKILEYLQNYKTHPTADMIFQTLVKDIPTLSKTTVYNTLKTFTEKGILKGLSLFENEVRYEYNKEPHMHFKCIKCGKIYDLPISCDRFEDNIIEGHRITEHHVNLKGFCRKCLQAE